MRLHAKSPANRGAFCVLGCGMTQAELFDLLPADTLAFEQLAQRRGFSVIAGIDEAGRGPLASVVAAAVILPKGLRVAEVDDSKKLAPETRERLFDVDHGQALCIGVGISGPGIIDRINILQATRQAMLQAVERLTLKPDYLLIDGISMIDMPIPQRTIKKGDSLSLSIAAASIIAKVTRDRLMCELDLLHPGYGFVPAPQGLRLCISHGGNPATWTKRSSPADFWRRQGACSMALFLISFLGIYGGLHVYVLISLRNAFRPSHGITILMAGVMFLMVVAPILVRLAEHSGRASLATALAWSNDMWMGAIFLLAAALLSLDIVRIAGWGITRLSGSPYPQFLSPLPTCTLALAVTFCATIYGYWEARSIRTEHLTVSSSKIPRGVNRVRIVRISDIHLGLINREDRLKRILSRVHAARPDILVSTGDLVDGRLSLQEDLPGQVRLEQMLTEVSAPRGKFAVTGNHEFYAGIDQSLAFTRTAGFTVLRGQTARVEPYLELAGVDDPAARQMGKNVASPPEQELLQGVPSGTFKVLLLKHRPLVSSASDGLFDLQLSGHTHQGQMFPFNLLVRLQYPVTGGTIRSAAGSVLHVSRGSGTWGPPLRLMAPPEVTIIDLVPAS